MLLDAHDRWANVPPLDRASGRHLNENEHYQTSTLTSGFFVFEARGSGSTFTSEGIAEMCALHASLTTDETPSPPYEGYQDFCQRNSPSGTGAASRTCFSGMHPLIFFFGDETYDIDDINLDDFLDTIGSPNFDPIARSIASFDPTQMAQTAAQHPTEFPRVLGYMNQLLGWIGVPPTDPVTFAPMPSPAPSRAWVDSPIQRTPTTVCTDASRKDPAKVLQVVAAIRGSDVLDDLLGGLVNFYFDRTFGAGCTRGERCPEGALRNVFTRALYNYGAPLQHGDPPFLDSNDRFDQQENAFVQWFWRDARLQQFYDENDRSLWRHLEPLGLIIPLLEQILLDLLFWDGIRAVFPLAVVVCVVWFQTRSLFIALVTILECFLSFVAAALPFYAVGIHWMAFENVLAVYIVLAIGADDVFVFMDVYKESFHRGPKVNASLRTRMSWVYRKAGLAMLITSLTTACAFVVTAASSPIPTLQNFGIFAALVILFDYVLVMTMLCASVVIYHNYFETKPGLLCACCSCFPAGSPVDWILCLPSKLGGCCALFTCTQQTTTEIGAAGGPETLPGARPFHVRLFADIFPFELVVRRRDTRLLSIVLFFGIAIPMAIQVGELTPQTSAEQLLPEDHPFQRAITSLTAFKTAEDDEVVEMQIVYGFNPSNPLDLHHTPRLFTPDELGDARYRSDFILDEAGQLALLHHCQLLKQSNLVRTTFEGGEVRTSVYCWIEAFKAYQEQCSGFPSEGFPVPASSVDDRVHSWLTTASYSGCPPEAMPNQGEGRSFGADLGWLPTSSATPRLAWTRVRAGSVINARGFLPASELRVKFEAWEELVRTLNANSSVGLGSAMQISSQGTSTADNKWLHMVLQETYVDMALTGVAWGLSVAFLVLLLATRNLIVSCLSILTILFALCCVVGTVVLRGWQLGMAESLSMMILTGFAVDYVVHLAHAYMESRKASRVERVHEALAALGISVFWGMLTSVIAAGVLSTLQLQFFSKFGFFFLLCIGWSYLWAVLFLMPLLAFVGPQGVGPHAEDPALTKKMFPDVEILPDALERYPGTAFHNDL